MSPTRWLGLAASAVASPPSGCARFVAARTSFSGKRWRCSERPRDNCGFAPRPVEELMSMVLDASGLQHAATAASARQSDGSLPRRIALRFVSCYLAYYRLAVLVP